MPKLETRVQAASISETIDELADRLTQEALADVDAGRLIDQQTMQTLGVHSSIGRYC